MAKCTKKEPAVIIVGLPWWVLDIDPDPGLANPLFIGGFDGVNSRVGPLDGFHDQDAVLRVDPVQSRLSWTVQTLHFTAVITARCRWQLGPVLAGPEVVDLRGVGEGGHVDLGLLALNQVHNLVLPRVEQGFICN